MMPILLLILFLLPAVFALPASPINEDSYDLDASTHAVTNTSEGIWQPPLGIGWEIVLLAPPTTYDDKIPVYDIDVWDNPKETVDSRHAKKQKVVCYFSAGTWESWRPDAGQFPDAVLGNKLGRWSRGQNVERWLDIRADVVRAAMSARIAKAHEQGCDAVDPDNVDIHDNNNGLSLSADDSLNYVQWLIAESHSRGMAFGLKNAPDLLPSVMANVQFAVNEECVQKGDCLLYKKFVAAGKPVLHIEYPKGDDINNDPVPDEQMAAACAFMRSHRFSTLIKNMDLDEWVQHCQTGLTPVHPGQ
ncbi:hypothetical protein P168DRAFT_337159 [Aspergillus campestris IBT 28561]|uniref:alpha-galactosidase n=1 Tax=Aspergillus campestris (strain IBT 28561) TaxID=1392248 RepID=A0A2I1CQW7_ASPC2|nr:uncharacterized protein P168DRAFT_337159 [Aspergillus campestris IBT 28561]PKY00015.1 hypothetical protein P168DRAFT_337159 [Aspergillus campestris IBT 28561]